MERTTRLGVVTELRLPPQSSPQCASLQVITSPWPPHLRPAQTRWIVTITSRTQLLFFWTICHTLYPQSEVNYLPFSSPQEHRTRSAEKALPPSYLRSQLFHENITLYTLNPVALLPVKLLVTSPAIFTFLLWCPRFDFFDTCSLVSSGRGDSSIYEQRPARCRDQ